MSPARATANNRLVPALAFLVLAAGAAAWSLWPRPQVVTDPGADLAPDPAQDPKDASAAAVDLLAWFGSYDGATAVPDVFVYAAPRAPAPGIERAGEDPGRRLPWTTPNGSGGAGEGGSRPAANGAPASGPASGGVAAGGVAAGGTDPVGRTPSGRTPSGPTPSGHTVPGGNAAAGGTDRTPSGSATNGNRQGPVRTGSASPWPVSESSPPADPGRLVHSERPLHQVSLVFITAGAARAVVDSKVVGVGDSLMAGRVVGIVADGIQVESGRERLFFRLGDPANDGTVTATPATPGGDK